MDSKWVRLRRQDFTGDNLLFSLDTCTQQEVEEFDLLPKHWKQELVHQARLAQPTLDAVGRSAQQHSLSASSGSCRRWVVGFGSSSNGSVAVFPDFAL